MRIIAQPISNPFSYAIDSDQLKPLFSYGTDALQNLLVAANCPETFYSYIYCLIGLSNGNIDVEIKNADLVKLVRISEEARSDNADELWLNRRQKGLRNWQQRNGFNFVEWISGRGRRKQQFTSGPPYVGIPTHYHLHILNHITTVMEEAQNNYLLWHKDPLEAIKLAAEKEVERLSRIPRLVSKSGKKFSRAWFVECGSYLTMTEGYLDEILRIVPAGGKLYGKYGEQVKRIEGKLSQLIANHT
jgi:hypothetical protein